MNAKVTKDMSDNIKAAAILADFYGYKTAYTDAIGSRGGQILNDKSGSPKVVTFKGSNNIPLKIGDNWFFCDTDADITIPNDLDDYLADSVVEDGTGTWTAASANVSFSTDTGQVKLAVAAGFTTGLVGYIDFAAKDFSTTGKNAISFLITSSINLYHGDLQFLADEHSACASPSCTLTVPGLKAGVQTRVILSFTALAADRDAIISIGLSATRDFGAADIWIDDIKTTSIEAGKDYCVYACDNSGTLVFKVSKATTYPAGFAAATSRKIGGFHTLALDVGIMDVTLTAADVPHDAGTILIDTKTYTFKTTLTPTEGEVLIGGSAAAAMDNLKAAVNHTGTPDTDYKCALAHPTVQATTNTNTTQKFQTRTAGAIVSTISTSATHLTFSPSGCPLGHTLELFATADIIPHSIWDLKHRPRSAPAGMVFSPRTGKWADIYLVSGTGASSLSVNGGTISDTRDWNDFVDDAGIVNKRLPTDSEHQCFSTGCNEETNIIGSADPVTTGPHIDTAGRRMITNIGCEDIAGVMWQWLQDQSYRYTPDGTSLTAAQTCAVTHAASPGGNPIYLKYGTDGDAYLCCNIAADTVDKFITFGTLYKLIIKHDVNANTGLPVYFDDDGTAPNRLLVNNTLNGGKDVYIMANNADFWLPVIHNANAATTGVAISYDDGADERLEGTLAGGVNANMDLSCGTGFNYYNLPGTKGSLYRQGGTADVKLAAGGNWNSGSGCGSRARYAYYSRWDTSTSFGARFVSEPL
jgi:hypothetical protein